MSPFNPKLYLSAVLALTPATARSAANIEYNRDIRPILSDKCFQCHGPDPATREADLRLDIREEAVEAGAIVPGEPAESEVITRIHESAPDEVMPPPESPRQLTAADRETLRKWIEQGAEYQPHWSFTPLPESIPLPPIKRKEWASHEIDRFVAARHEAESLQAAPPATPERWLRRGGIRTRTAKELPTSTSPTPSR